MFSSAKAMVAVAAACMFSAAGMAIDVVTRSLRLHKELDVTRTFLVVLFAYLAYQLWRRRAQPTRTGKFIAVALFAAAGVVTTLFILRNDLQLLSDAG